MLNLAPPYHTNPDYYYSYTSTDLSTDVMAPFVRVIRDYDPIFKKNYQELSNKLPAVLTSDPIVIQQFTEILNLINDKIIAIKNKAPITRNNLTYIRDDLTQSIRHAKTKLDELAVQKEALNGQKQIIEKQISAKKAEINGYMAAFWIFSWIIALILESIKPFDAALNEIKDNLATNQREIDKLNQDEKKTQQLLIQSIDLFNSNQALCAQCDAIQDNINNIQDSLKRLDLESHLLNAKLMTLKKDWSGLMDIGIRST